MGSVHEAALLGAEGFEKVIAIKTILEHLTGDWNIMEMFIGEAKLAADLVHQNIVQIYKLGRLEKQYYIALGTSTASTSNTSTTATRPGNGKGGRAPLADR